MRKPGAQIARQHALLYCRMTQPPPDSSKAQMQPVTKPSTKPALSASSIGYAHPMQSHTHMGIVAWPFQLQTLPTQRDPVIRSIIECLHSLRLVVQAAMSLQLQWWRVCIHSRCLPAQVTHMHGRHAAVVALEIPTACPAGRDLARKGAMPCADACMHRSMQIQKSDAALHACSAHARPL